MADTMTLAEDATAAFDKEAVETRATGSPEWLQQRRRAAWETYEQTPLPTTNLEEWRYTEVSQLELDAVRLPDAEAGSAPALAAGVVGDAAESAARAVLADKPAAARVVLVGSAPAQIELEPALREQGVILMDLAAAAWEHPDLVREHLGVSAVPATAGKFAALNGALWQGGVFLYVPRGVRIELPIRVAHWLGAAGEAHFPRTLIVAEERSKLAFVDEFVSPDLDAPTLSCGVVEVIAGTGARVHYVALQRWGRGVRHVSTQRTIAARDAQVDTLVVNLGGSVSRVDLAASLEGPGARSDMLGLYFGHADQHFDHNTRQDHVAPHASSDLLYKGALYDESRAVFRGLIRVHPKAQRTDAYQTNRNLLLSEDARADSLPNLEIEADDVRCSHGATVGHLDQEAVFYLMSRGLPRRQAERLVVLGFLGEVLKRLPLPSVVDELRAAIEAQVGNGDGTGKRNGNVRG